MSSAISWSAIDACGRLSFIYGRVNSFLGLESGTSVMLALTSHGVLRPRYGHSNSALRHIRIHDAIYFAVRCCLMFQPISCFLLKEASGCDTSWVYFLGLKAKATSQFQTEEQLWSATGKRLGRLICRRCASLLRERNKRMKISDVRATTVAVPLEAPLRHANGAHWGRFVRTVVEVETDDGLIGLGEMGGGGESAENAVRALKSYLLGHDPLQLEQLYWKICNPTASLYNNRAQLHAAIEFACIDLAGKKLGVRACDLLGGALREEVPFASYLFYRYADPETGAGGEETAEEMVGHAKHLRNQYGFQTHK